MLHDTWIVGRADALAVVEMMAGWIEQLAAEAARRFRAAGPDPIRHERGLRAGRGVDPARRVAADHRLAGRPALAGLRRSLGQEAELKRRPPPNRGPYVASVTDLMAGNANAYTPGGLLELRGSRLKFDAAQADEAVFFRPPGGGAEVRADRYLQVFPKTTQVVVPATVTRPQRLIVRRRPRPTQPEPTQFTYDTVLGPA